MDVLGWQEGKVGEDSGKGGADGTSARNLFDGMSSQYDVSEEEILVVMIEEMVTKEEALHLIYELRDAKRRIDEKLDRLLEMFGVKLDGETNGVGEFNTSTKELTSTTEAATPSSTQLISANGTTSTTNIDTSDGFKDTPAKCSTLVLDVNSVANQSETVLVVRTSVPKGVPAHVASTEVFLARLIAEKDLITLVPTRCSVKWHGQDNKVLMSTSSHVVSLPSPLIPLMLEALFGGRMVVLGQLLLLLFEVKHWPALTLREHPCCSCPTAHLLQPWPPPNSDEQIAGRWNGSPVQLRLPRPSLIQPWPPPWSTGAVIERANLAKTKEGGILSVAELCPTLMRYFGRAILTDENLGYCHLLYLCKMWPQFMLWEVCCNQIEVESLSDLDTQPMTNLLNGLYFGVARNPATILYIELKVQRFQDLGDGKVILQMIEFSCWLNSYLLYMGSNWWSLIHVISFGQFEIGVYCGKEMEFLIELYSPCYCSTRVNRREYSPQPAEIILASYNVVVDRGRSGAISAVRNLCIQEFYAKKNSYMPLASVACANYWRLHLSEIVLQGIRIGWTIKWVVQSWTEDAASSLWKVTSTTDLRCQHVEIHGLFLHGRAQLKHHYTSPNNRSTIFSVQILQMPWDPGDGKNFILFHFYRLEGKPNVKERGLLGTRLGCIWAKLAMSKRGPSKPRKSNIQSSSVGNILGIEQIGHGGGGDLEAGWLLVDLLLYPFSPFTCSRSF